MNAIFEITNRRRTPKYQQIVNSITKAIKDGRLRNGERITSINELSAEFGLSRDTVQRAYNLLEKENIIEAVKGKGFYINRTDIMARLRVLLVFNRMSNYKKMIYDSFVQTMGKQGTVDLRIHQANVNLLKEIIDTQHQEYDYYVVMPHFYENTAEACGIISQLPNDKLMILDKALDYPGLDCSGVYQDFENDIRDALATGLNTLRKYSKLVYVHPIHTLHPGEIITGFRRFCADYDFSYDVINEIGYDHDVKKGETFIVIEESDLANVIRNCERKKLRVGHDVGIISYNDTPIKRMLLEGISILSTDHFKMGETAAQLILNNRHEKIRIPFKLILRNSV